jgi:hypothetical protein
MGHTRHFGRPQVENTQSSTWNIPILNTHVCSRFVFAQAVVFCLTHILYLSTLSDSLLSSTCIFIYLPYKVVILSSGVW